jgi:hypothetical protein
MSLFLSPGWRWPRGRRAWVIILAVIGVVAVVFVLLSPSPSMQASRPPAAVESSRGQQPSPSASAAASPQASSTNEGMDDSGQERHTKSFRDLAVAAAQDIYTWDTRTLSYSEVYARLRDLWTLLPDGSNPLTVLVQEFEATGVTAGTYMSLAGVEASRTGTAESVACDAELAKVREYPAPWAGLHVCTVRVNVIDQTARGRNDYVAPISVMINCPPAPTAPGDRCAMVGFYATPSRIVY